MKIDIIEVKENIGLGIKVATLLNSGEGLYHANAAEVTSKEVDF